MNGLTVKLIEDDKLTDNDLKRHRVGGRLVRRREITRSKRFISLLANLFCDLQYDQDASVTPALELAKLALVTSKDEEEDEDKCGTEGYLVEEGNGVTRLSQTTAIDVDSPVS
ncbi:hypothetical protein C8F01DRAFT_1381353 [Mycena amicta]|nr:hypothetical protein C8F01DRAFT_1381353 [Mycena amicta]